MVYDLIDYHLRECIKREVKMRVCKNCGRYFALTGRTNTEYCSRPFDEKGRTCREVGAIALWTKRKSRDALFQDYRREYKNRFARMKAGKLEPEELYAWDERAREKKAECEAGGCPRKTTLPGCGNHDKEGKIKRRRLYAVYAV